MNVGGLRFPRVQRDELDVLLERAEQAPLGYDHVGSTLERTDLRRWQRSLGDGAAFDVAVAALRAWAPQRSIARIHPEGASLAAGQTLLVVLRAGPIDVVAPVRVVRIIDEPSRFGYLYGTLPGHPERGEELFLVERDEHGATTATIVVDAVPGSLPARLASPLVGVLQRRAIGRYLQALS